MFEHSLTQLLITFAVGIIAAVYGSAVGGGALLTVPVLHYLGLPLSTAIGTSRLGSLGVSSVGLAVFSGKNQVDWKLAWQMTYLKMFGTTFGALALLNLPEIWAQRLVSFIILLVFFVFLTNPTLGLQERTVSKDSLRYKFGYLFTFLLGFLAGFYQGGSGTMAAFIMIVFFGQTFLESAGTRKLPFLIINTLALGIYAYYGKVHWELGVVLGVGTAVGSYVGSLLAIKKGNRWIRLAFLLFIGLSGVRMFYQSFLKT